MSEKFNIRWKEHYVHYNEFARITRVWNKFSSYSTYFLAAKRTRWIRQGKGEEVQPLTPETCPHRDIFMGMMSGIPIPAKGPKGGHAQFLQNAERSAAYFGKFKPQYYMYIGSGPEGTWTIEMCPDDPKGHWDQLAKQVTEVYRVQKYPILKGCSKFREGESKRGGENMHFNASDTSKKIIMDLISSVKDMCILHGICNDHGKINQGGLESRQTSASIVLSPRVSETASPSPASAVDNLSDHAWIAEGHLSARASTFESDWFADSARAAEGNVWLILNEETNEAVVEKGNVTREKELLRLCTNTNYAEILRIGQYIQTRPARNSSGTRCTPCGEADRPTRLIGGRVLRRISPGCTIQKNTFFGMEGCSGIDVKCWCG